MNQQSWAVLKAMVNSSFGVSVARWRYLRRRERLWEPALVVFGIGTAVAFFGYGIYRLALAITGVGLVVGQPELGLGMAAVISQMLVLLMGFFLVVSAFFFARDLTMLVPLPVRPGTIITAKFVTVLLWQYITVAFVFVPAVLAYMAHVPLTLGQVLVAVVVFLLIPVLPLAISAAFALLLMRGLSRRHRDVMFYAGSLIFLGLILASQVFTGGLPSDPADLQRYLEELISGRLGLVQLMTRRFPPALWGTLAVHSFPAWEGLRNLAYTIGSAGAAFWALGLMGNRLFYRGLIGSDEAAGRRPAMRRRAWRAQGEAAAGALVGRPSTALAALVRREWSLLSRTPVWMLNNVLPGLLMPLFMLLPFALQSELREMVAQLANNPELYTVAALALAAFLGFVSSVTGIAPTAISREGGRLWISRVIPQSGAAQLQAKLVLSVAVVAVTAVPTVAAFAVILKPPLVHLLGGTLVGLVSGFSVMVIGLRTDLSRPMLRWQDPQEPVKRNLNALVPLGVVMAYVALGAISYTGLDRLGAPGLLVYALLLAAAATVATVSYRHLMNRADELFGRLEV